MKHSFKYNTKLTLKKKFPQQLVLKRLLGIVPRVANQCTKISRGQQQTARSVHRGGRLAPAPGLSPPPEGRAGCTVKMPLPPEHPPFPLAYLPSPLQMTQRPCLQILEVFLADGRGEGVFQQPHCTRGRASWNHHADSLFSVHSCVCSTK